MIFKTDSLTSFHFSSAKDKKEKQLNKIKDEMESMKTQGEKKIDLIKKKLADARDDVKAEREKWVSRMEKLNDDLDCVSNRNYLDRRRHRNAAAKQAEKSDGTCH